MEAKKLKSRVKEQEAQGIKEMKAMNQKYLESGQGSIAVRDFLKKAEIDEAVLLRNLRGRKYRPKHAWETVKHYAEVRFDKYPEPFLSPFPKQILPLIANHAFGILKSRDTKGRIVGYGLGREWDPEKMPTDTLLAAAIHIAEHLVSIADLVSNEVIVIQDCDGMGLNHLKQYTLFEMRRVIDVFWRAYPIQVKGVYFVNVPYIASVVYKIIRPFFPKKLKDRFWISYAGEKFDTLHEHISPDILPKCLGGKLEDHEAVDSSFLKIN